MRPQNDLILGTQGAASITGVSTGANQNSIPQWTDQIVRTSFQTITTGTCAGTIQIQISDDKSVGLPANQFVPTNWSNLGTPTTVTIAGVYNTGYLECSYEYMRLVWTDTSSGTNTGTVQARMKSMAL